MDWKHHKLTHEVKHANETNKNICFHTQSTKIWYRSFNYPNSYL